MKRSRFGYLLLAPLVVAACSQMALAQNLLINGDLDAGTAGGDPDGGGPLPPDPGTNPPWTITNTGHPTVAQYQGGFADNTLPPIPGPPPSDPGLGIWYRSFLGSAAAPVSATLSQSAVAPLGGQYLLTFDAVVEPNFSADSMIATLSSSGGGSATLDLLTKKATNPPYTGGGFNGALTSYNIQQSVVLNGVSALDTLTVSLAMTNGVSTSGAQSVVADNFSLVRIPEPTTVALAGIGLIGLLAHRRRH